MLVYILLLNFCKGTFLCTIVNLELKYINPVTCSAPINVNIVTIAVLLLCFSLQKDYRDRLNYTQLLAHPFCQRQRDNSTDITQFVSEILDLPESP